MRVSQLAVGRDILGCLLLFEAVKAYKSGSNSLGSGQVLHEPYTADKARIVLRGMNLADGATMRDRNGQIGGHKA